MNDDIEIKLECSYGCVGDEKYRDLDSFVVVDITSIFKKLSKTCVWTMTMDGGWLTSCGCHSRLTVEMDPIKKDGVIVGWKLADSYKICEFCGGSIEELNASIVVYPDRDLKKG